MKDGALNATSPSTPDLLHIQVKGDNGLFTYWMQMQAPSNTTLKDLDAFLRKTWVECCGHMSQFMIDGKCYSVHPGSSMGNRSMRPKLGDVLREEKAFSYEYDFGTTTTLGLKVIAARQTSAGLDRAKSGDKIVVLARNDPPEIACDSCDKNKATQVCAQCIFDEDEAWLCEDCAPEHDCVKKDGEEILLPIVNSPRVGMCGYTG